jgi:cytochrome P450
VLCYAVYAVTLHPLASYKDPILWTTTRIPHTYHLVRGTLSFKEAELHQKYGAVVRIGANELSYIREDAWKDICGHRPGNAELIEDMSVITPPPGTAYGILTTPSTKDHARMRRNLNHRFSDKALRDQEPQIMKYVELLIDRVRNHSKDGPIDMARWYNFTTFDIIGELFFGESFNMLESAEWNEWLEHQF